MSKKLATILILIFPFLQTGLLAQQMREDVEMLCCERFEGRAHASVGNMYASHFLARRFEQEGLLPASEGGYISRFLMPQGWNYGRNVVGIFPGFENFPVNSYIIIGAHFDGLGVIGGRLYPCADSNASGVAMILDIARRFAQMRRQNAFFSCSIIFVAFDAFAEGRAGAENLWEEIASGRLLDPVSKVPIRPHQIKLMIDIDQIGSDLVPPEKSRKDYIIALGAQTLPDAQNNILERCNESSASNLDIWHSYYGSEKFTRAFYRLGDRKTFISAGLPVLYFTSGITPLNNSVGDTPGSLNYELMDRRSRLITAVAEYYLRH